MSNEWRLGDRTSDRVVGHVQNTRRISPTPNSLRLEMIGLTKGCNAIAIGYRPDIWTDHPEFRVGFSSCQAKIMPTSVEHPPPGP